MMPAGRGRRPFSLCHVATQVVGRCGFLRMSDAMRGMVRRVPAGDPFSRQTCRFQRRSGPPYLLFVRPLRAVDRYFVCG